METKRLRGTNSSHPLFGSDLDPMLWTFISNRASSLLWLVSHPQDRTGPSACTGRFWYAITRMMLHLEMIGRSLTSVP
eukprot:6048855-Prorocentrum_lima.AAC.1